jgi:hypothetical protein
MTYPPIVPGQQPNPASAWPPDEPTPAWTGPDPAAPPPSAGRRRGWIPWVIAGAAVVALVAVLVVPRVTDALADSDAPPAKQNLLKAAQTSCDAGGSGTRLADGDRTLIVEGAGKDNPSGLSASAIICIFGAVGMPTAVSERVESTRALDGQVEDSWPGYRATWTYHPDAGLNMIVTQAG